MPDLIPAALIGKLALHLDLQGQGLGKLLLMDALSRIIKVSRQGPAIRAIVVDAANPLANHLYSSMGFRQVDATPGRMVVRASAVEQSLIQAGLLPSP
jgi:GNAT superfamily N-acetyltransferase